MLPIRLAVIALAALLLTACSGGDKPAAETAAATATPTPATSQALQALFGTWGLDPAHCDDQVLKVSATAFAGSGTACTVASYVDNGDGTFTAAMRCGSGAESVDEKVQLRPIFTPTGEGIDLVYLSRNNQQSEVLRCGTAS